METVTIKMDEVMLKELDQKIKKHNFSTRTEFIREALREKLNQIEKDELIKEFLKLRGASKTKTTDKELRKAREEVFQELAKKRGWD